MSWRTIPALSIEREGRSVLAYLTMSSYLPSFYPRISFFILFHISPWVRLSRPIHCPCHHHPRRRLIGRCQMMHHQQQQQPFFDKCVLVPRLLPLPSPPPSPSVPLLLDPLLPLDCVPHSCPGRVVSPPPVDWHIFSRGASSASTTHFILCLRMKGLMTVHYECIDLVMGFYNNDTFLSSTLLCNLPYIGLSFQYEYKMPQ